MRNIELIKHLALREMRVRYKQSFLGFFWILINPFAQMLIMSFVFSRVMKIDTIAVPYPIYLYAGLLPWLFFSTSLSASMTTLIENSSLIKKIYFPREILVFSTLIAKTIDFFFSTLVFIILLLWFRVPFTWYMLLFFPLFIIQFFFTFGLALLVSALNLLYRDVQYIFNLILTLWFYITPIIYAVEFIPSEFRWIFRLNPLSVFINAYRQVLFGNGLPNITSLGIGIGISTILFAISYKLFKKLEKVFADVV